MISCPNCKKIHSVVHPEVNRCSCGSGFDGSGNEIDANIPNDLTINSTSDVTSTGQVTAGTTVGGVTLTMTGAGTMTTINTGQGATEVYAMNQDVQTSKTFSFQSF